MLFLYTYRAVLSPTAQFHVFLCSTFAVQCAMAVEFYINLMTSCSHRKDMKIEGCRDCTNVCACLLYVPAQVGL